MTTQRLHPQCISCLLEKNLKNIPDNFTTVQKSEYMQGVLKIIGSADNGMSAPEIVGEIREFKEKFGGVFDYCEIKDYFNRFMLSLENDIWDKIENSQNSLKMAVKYAMVGNFIDFGAMESVDEQKLKETLENTDKLIIDDTEYEQFENEIMKADNIAYLTDNCGEIVLDKLLIKQILKLNSNVKINVIVRGKPVLNDCTIDDAKQVGMEKIVSVIGNGTSVAGTVLNKISTEPKAIIDNADLIISKGQGNFETLHGCGKNIYYLFLCKCKMFADRFGVESVKGIFVNDKHLSNFIDD